MSALAMTGTMLTTLLRRFMNSMSRGLSLKGNSAKETQCRDPGLRSHRGGHVGRGARLGLGRVQGERSPIELRLESRSEAGSKSPHPQRSLGAQQALDTAYRVTWLTSLSCLGASSVGAKWETSSRSSGPWDRLTVPQVSSAPESQGLMQGAGRRLAEPECGHHFSH